MLAQVHDLLPNLENPQALRQQLKDIAVEMRNNKLGKLQELNDAAARALRQDPGKQVRLGGQGDVVDPTASEVVQHKNQTTADPRNVTRELQKAARQLAGGGGEHPPADYTRLIEITLRYEGNGPRNPLLGAGPEEIQPFLRQALHDYPNMADRVRFSNERGSWTFDGPDWTPSTEPNSPGRPGRPEQVDPRLSVPESTEDGKHETFETPEGFKICSDECQLMRDRYETVLKGRRDLKAKLTRFEKMPEKTDAQVAAKEAAREQIYEELKAARLEKTMQEIDARFRAEIDNAPAAKKDDVRFKRYLEKAKERVKAKVLDKGDVLTRAEWDVALKLIRANARRGSAEERASLKDLGIENNNMPARGEPLTLNTELGERIPDGVTDRFFVDVKALEDGVFYYTEQLRAFRRAGATGRPDGIRRELAVVLTGKRAFNADGTPKVRPSEPLAADALVLHRNSQTQEWMLWDPQAHGGQGNWAAVTQDNVRQYLGGSPP